MYAPRRDRHRLSVVTSVALGLVLAVGACGKSGTPDATPTARVPDRSPTTAVDTDTSPATTVPGTAAASDRADFDAVMRRILTRRDEAYEQNKPEYLDEIYLPQCKCLAGEKAEIARRIAEGVHTSGERLTVLRVDTINLNGPNEAAVRVVYAQGPHRLVNASGETVREQPSEPRSSLAFFLGRYEGRWKVISITPEGPAKMDGAQP